MIAGAKYENALDTGRLQLHKSHLTGRLVYGKFSKQIE
jgi:hypothetical protein